MTKYALIKNDTGKVVEINENKFSVHPSLSWIECDDTITTSHVYSDGAFIEEAVPQLSANEIALNNRLEAYGPPAKQLEYITENGLQAWQDYVDQVKIDNPFVEE